MSQKPVPEGKYAQLPNGYRLHYLEEGKGPAVVFLHGSGNGASGYSNFKGNYPDRCSVQAAFVAGGTDRSITTQSMFWQTLLPEQKLEMDAIHTFTEQVAKLGPITHVRFNIFPDGGVSRLRLWGKVEAK